MRSGKKPLVAAIKLPKPPSLSGAVGSGMQPQFGGFRAQTPQLTGKPGRIGRKRR